MTETNTHPEFSTASEKSQVTTAHKHSLIIGIAIIAISTLVIAILAYFYRGQDVDSPLAAASPQSAQSNAGDPPQSGSPEDILEAAKAAGCNLTPQEILDPTRFTMVRDTRTLTMMSLSRDESDAAGAPPISEGYTVGWFNEGPKLGSTQGKAVLTSHTYFTGTALGNELNNGLWSRGDIIKVEDNNGNNACYTYRDNAHILVEHYDPESSIVYDEANSPMFAMVVCSDWDEHGNPLGRMIYYADLITEHYPKQPPRSDQPTNASQSAVATESE